MIKKIVIFSAILIGAISCHSSKQVQSNQVSEEWVDLFNGKNLDHWIPKFYKAETGVNYLNTFRVKDNAIQVNYDDYKTFDSRYGHLFYDKEFSSYHLKFSYRFTDQWLEDAPHFTYRNSGVMFHSQDPKTILKDQDWPVSVEYQILAEEKAGESRPTGNMCSPGTDVIFEDKIDDRHCIRSSSKTYKWDEWIEGELIVYKDSLITHMVNGNKVLEYSKPQIGGGVAKGFDENVIVDKKALTTGYIALQAEGQGIEFKDIKIKEFR